MLRLLRRVDNEFQLVEFEDYQIPEYAILSHTWGSDSEEVSYEDILEKRASQKSGYVKLEFCADRAASNGLLYFWSDTCCINKSNSPQFDEAIRSMFRWYARATRCYVYLSDVPDPKDPAADVDTAFAKSRWFTRGWTLQELIAPKVVEFYDSNAVFLGTKTSRIQQIHLITGVPVEALKGQKAPSQFSTSERLSWAANRQTKREEDSAYCLLGLFDIHIPVMYGEGKAHAQNRLHLAIRQALYGVSSLAPRGKWLVPFDRNPNFTGRKAELDRLERMIATNDSTAKIAITGLGGIGKTQILLEFLYRIKLIRTDYSILWIPATSAEALHQGYLEVARLFELQLKQQSEQDIKQIVHNYLSTYEAGQWILVFDNADDSDTWTSSGQESQALINYLPRSNRSCIIFTTRDRKIAVNLTKRNIINVEQMDVATSIKLLKNSLIAPQSPENEDCMADLLFELAYLPLAIIQASAYLNDGGITIREYLPLLQDKEEHVIDLLSYDFEDDGRYYNVKNPVATTWLVSFEQIRKRSALAIEYLSFMACIDHKDIPQSLLPPGPSHKKEMDALGILDAFSFITRRPSEHLIDLHRLVHLAIRNWLRNEDLFKQWTKIAATRLNEVSPLGKWQDRDGWRKYAPHARCVVKSDWTRDEGEKRLDLRRRYAISLYQEEKWDEAEPLFARELKELTEENGTENLQTMYVASWLAIVYKNQNQLQKAETLLSSVLETSKRLYGEEHRETLYSKTRLAEVYWRRGQFKEAEKLEVEVLETRTKLNGSEHAETLSAMVTLAETYRKQERLEEAENLHNQALVGRTKVLGAEHADTIRVLVYLALVYTAQKKYIEAEETQQQALKLRTKVLGAKHPDTLKTMWDLAHSWKSLGRGSEAIELLQKCFEMEKQVLGEDHESTNITRRALARWQAESTTTELKS